MDWADEFNRGWRAKYIYGLMYVRVDSECHQLGTPVNLDGVKTEYFKVGTGYGTSLTDNYRQVKGRASRDQGRPPPLHLTNQTASRGSTLFN